MHDTELKKRRARRKQLLEHPVGCMMNKYGAIVFAKSPKNDSISTCTRCGKEKRIHSGGICSNCYDKKHAKGVCKECSKHAVLRKELCDNCYRNKYYQGKCRICKKTDVLRKELCQQCYKKHSFLGICRECGKENHLTKGLCNHCWDFQNRRGTCKCGNEGSLRDSLCSTCYKRKNAKGECKLCGSSGVLTDGMCKTCYDKENYRGVCDSCGNVGVLVNKYCRTCHDQQDKMETCEKCNNIAILDHNRICNKCKYKEYDISVCRVCGKERPIVFGNMCLECYKNKAQGIRHYMKSSMKKLLSRLLGKDNFNIKVQEIYLKGEREPFQPDFELMDLTGRWCPAQFFNSREDWSAQYKNVLQFKEFYNKFLKPRNYIMFTCDHSHPESLKKYLTDRGFLQPDGLPYGKKITKKDTERPLSKRM